MEVQDIVDPSRTDHIPGVEVDNRQQLEKSGVSSVAALGKLTKTAFSSPSIEIGQECLSCTSFWMMIRFSIALCSRLLQLRWDYCPPLVPGGSHFSPVTLFVSPLANIQKTMPSTVSNTDWELCATLTQWWQPHCFMNGQSAGQLSLGPLWWHQSQVMNALLWGCGETTVTSPSLWVRDPECFIAGEIHRHLYFWK